MRESLVGLRHPVCILSLLNRNPSVLGCVEDLVGELLDHRLLRTGTGKTGQPPERQSFTSNVGLTLMIAFWKIFRGSSVVRSSILLKASNTSLSALDFFPCFMITAMKLVTKPLL